MPFYYVVLTSLSVKTLVMLHYQVDGQIPSTHLRMPFVSEAFVTDRLDTMVANGFLTKADGAYAVTSKGEKIARTFIFLKLFWKLGPGG
jgi:predicted transcriptional regulator